MLRFKVPIIATVAGVVLMIVVGLIGVTAIHNSDGSNREKKARAESLGTAVATLGGIVIAPFWFYSAYKIGQHRRNRK